MSRAVWAAFEANDAEAFEAAIKACPNPNAVLVNCQNPLPCQAARLGKNGILAAALRADAWGVTAADDQLRTPLHYACLGGDLEAVRAVFELKPERVHPDMLMKQRDNVKMTPLHSAVLSGNEELVLFLLDVGQGAAVDMESISGSLPLHLACSKGMAAAVEVMCKHERAAGAVGKPAPNGETLLHSATMEGHEEVVKVLVDSGLSKPNLQDTDGCTALHIAYAMGLSEIVEVLLPVTDQSIVDLQGRQAIDWSMDADADLEEPAEHVDSTSTLDVLPLPSPTKGAIPRLVKVAISISKSGKVLLSICPLTFI